MFAHSEACRTQRTDRRQTSSEEEGEPEEEADHRGGCYEQLAHGVAVDAAVEECVKFGQDVLHISSSSS